ncbi:hypothetical protein FRB94_004703 [Tulasnella sp. JGI-2019a]|nr:hypothetical protein FRB94_004703 [Tulasnella sp. JGI-2019a]
MADAREYRDGHVETEFTLPPGSDNPMKSIRFPRRVIEDVFPTMAGPSVLQTALEHPLRAGSVGPFYRGMATDLTIEAAVTASVAAGTAAAPLQDKDAAQDEDELEVEFEIEIEVAVVHTSAENDEADAEELGHDGMELDASRAERDATERRSGTKRARDELEDDSEGTASGSSSSTRLSRVHCKMIARDSIRKRDINTSLNRHLPIRHTGGSRQPSPAASSDDMLEVESAASMKRRRIAGRYGERPETTIREGGVAFDHDINTVLVATQPEITGPLVTSAAPITAGVVAPASPVPSAKFVADASVPVEKTKRRVGLSYAERQVAWQQRAAVG